VDRNSGRLFAFQSAILVDVGFVPILLQKSVDVGGEQ
jgi:hypothetical protein